MADLTTQKGDTDKRGWWHVRFRVKWPDNEEPKWHLDLLLAHKIIAPLLEMHRARIDLWRFHRRAFRDEEGHQFSLIFYSSPDLANRVYADVASAPIVKRLIRAGILCKIVYEDTSAVRCPNIRDTSDGNWSGPIMKTWPWFIMGVCQMWLLLIHESSLRFPSARRNPSLKELMTAYTHIDDTVKKHWRDEGGHALLHHLNAIYGYEPLVVREVKLQRF